MSLSLNPMTWTPSNIAEAAVEGLTGSEFAGKIAGSYVGFATGDIRGGWEKGAAAAGTVGQFLTDARVREAAQEHFGTGATKAPEGCACPAAGYAPPTQAPTQDAGRGEDVRGTRPTRGAAGQVGQLSGSGSLQDRIFELLMKLLEKKEGELEDKLRTAEGAEGGKGEQTAMFELQKANSELSQLQSLTTNLMSAFDQTNKGIIQNIR